MNDRIGPFRIERLLGKGGFASVWLCRDEKLDSPVAVKVLAENWAADPDMSRRFLQEARILRLLDDDRIVRVYSVDKLPDGRPYFAMHYADGGSLEDRAAQRQADGKPISVQAAVDLASELADCLHVVHSVDVVHRDLKPSNILFDSRRGRRIGPPRPERMLLSDFGMARPLKDMAQTVAGGTPLYMAPEQQDPDRAGEVDERADIYAASVILYELLAGRVPYEVDSLRDKPPDGIGRPDVPRALETALESGLSSDARDRPASAKEWAALVRSALRVSIEPAPTVIVERRAPDAPQESTSVQIPLPPTLLGSRRVPFVAREREIAWLRERWEQAKLSHQQLIVVSGEPGIGKKRLASEFALSVFGEGATVLFGRCDEEPLVPYQPFVEALRHYVGSCQITQLRQLVPTQAAGLAKLIPELHQRLGHLPAAEEADAETERFRLFEAVSWILLEAARRAPLLLVLANLHWADKPTLLLLRHLAHKAEPVPLVVLATYRDTEPGQVQALTETVADLRREYLLDRLALPGLGDEGVGVLVGALAGPGAAPAFVHALGDQTEGNPFFIEEVLRNLAELGTQEPGALDHAIVIPEGVKEIIGRRLSRLTEAAREALSLACVAGREFDLDVLERVSDIPDERMIDALEEALLAHIVSEVPGKPGRYVFSRNAIRETLYEGLSSIRRVRLHRRIAQALEALYGADPGPHLAELAHHYLEAMQPEDVPKVVDYCRRAGDHALDLLAYEDAAEHYERAGSALERRVPLDLEQRIDLLVKAGDASTRAGDPAKARKAFLAAAEAAQRDRDATQAARAGLRYAATFADSEPPDDLLSRLLETALAALPESDSLLRVRLLEGLARALPPLDTRRDSLTRVAEAMSERLGHVEIPESEPSPPERAPETAPQPREKVLLVDDEEDILLLLARVLERNSFAFATARSVGEARERLLAEPFALVLVDLWLGTESGIDLAAEIRDRWPDTAVVMVTAQDDTAAVDRALDAGAYGYVVKPFKPTELVAQMKSALRHRALG